MKNKFIKILLIGWLSISSLPQVHAFTEWEDGYVVVGISEDQEQLIQKFTTYKNAKLAYNKAIGNYDNVFISYEGEIIQAQYAVVKVQSTSSCDYNVEFRNSIDNGSNYINGCYGADAAYLDTSSDGSKVKFKISGVEGWANKSDMEIIPVEFVNSRLSTYIVKGENLYHQIKQSFASDFYAAMIDLGKAPVYLQEDIEYYSYDGHYFYHPTQFREMLDDYKKGEYSSSVNQDDPYYNYYQYITHRSLTKVTYEEMKRYFAEELKIYSPIDSYLDLDKDSSNDTLTQSQFYGQESSFYQYQYQYGANALMMIALSMNETAMGRSSLAFTRNNLFGHAAYDSDVEKNASRYFDVSSSIYSHAKYYISGSYTNPSRFQFHGGYFGNKANGMNVSYASDPYWGEKAAMYYLKVDEAFGYKDYNAHAIGIKTSLDNVPIYSEPHKDSKVIYRTGKMPEFSFLILDLIDTEEGMWYKVQSEATIDSNDEVDISYFYDFENYVGYVLKDDIQIVLNEEQLTKIDWVEVTFDAQDGSFLDGSSVLTYTIESNNTPVIEKPQKENALFVGWDKEVIADSEDRVYVAQYRLVDRIEMVSSPKMEYEYNDRIDLSEGKIEVFFSDGETEVVSLTSSMVSGYDLKEPGRQEVSVRYAGKEIAYPIEVRQDLDDLRQEIQSEIIQVIEELGNSDKLSEEQVDKVLGLKRKMDEGMIPYLNQVQLRTLDQIIYKAINHQIYYVIYDNGLDASVSGLSLSIPLGNSLDKSLFKDTYKLTVKKGIKRESFQKVSDVAAGNGYQIHFGMTVTLDKNLKKEEFENPVVISVKKPKNSQSNQLFTVLMFDDGDIIKTYTKQTNEYIQFMASSTGEFVIVSRNTTNEYMIEDVLETVRVNNRDIDLPLILSILLVLVIVVVTVVIILDYQWRRFKKSRNKKRRKLEVEKEDQKEKDFNPKLIQEEKEVVE